MIYHYILKHFSSKYYLYIFILFLNINSYSQETYRISPAADFISLLDLPFQKSYGFRISPQPADFGGFGIFLRLPFTIELKQNEVKVNWSTIANSPFGGDVGTYGNKSLHKTSKMKINIINSAAVCYIDNTEPTRVIFVNSKQIVTLVSDTPEGRYQ